ncbi:hypothetical protein BaRGS_00012769 [Batillaria attramentaria]|uniref:Peptidylamidoglycolate lyase n=1 Tax=Batillaria attramentaria TaxID=370345 RepID=A0ABD0LA11_9CAEN
MAACVAVVLLACCFTVALTSIVTKENSSWDIRMKQAKPAQPDAYLCASYKVEEDEAYIVKFEAVANASTAHHILMYGCEYGPASNQNIWGCPPICAGGPQQIMFAWAKNAPPTQLPEGVGLRIANEKPDDSGLRLHLKKERQPYVAGIFLLMSYNFAVPPNNPKYHVDISCEYNRQYSMFPFAYRTHAHGLGSVITGYQYNGSYHLIGKGNPQWRFIQQMRALKSNRVISWCVTELPSLLPQFRVDLGDAARCTYNSTGRFRTTDVGATGNDEMCNFYIMFYTDAAEERPSSSCGGNKYRSLIANLPPGNDVTLPPNPALDEVAHGHHHHHGSMTGSTEPSGTAPSGESHDTAHEHPSPAQGDSNRSNKQSQVNLLDSWRDSSKTYGMLKATPLLQQQSQAASDSDGFSDDGIEGVGNSQERLGFGEMLNNPADAEYRGEQLPDLSLTEEWLDSLGPMTFQKRLGSEYYDDYAANDEREHGTFPEPDPGLSRNRNKAFEAMNQEMKNFQHIKPHAEPGSGSNLGWQHHQKTSSRKKIGDLAASQPQKGGSFEPLPGKLEFQSQWPKGAVQVGQVGGVATDKNGNVYVFHRGHRVWDQQSFDIYDNFQFPNDPIMNDTVFIFSRDGRLLRQFGRGMFFMPHGIEVDNKGNIWLTDVALHQVFRFPPNSTEPDLTLGERFVHKLDASHFCKPSDIAVLSTGDFYVTDGYCHSRVLKFSKDGNLVGQWGKQNIFRTRGMPPAGTFDIPHSVTVAEDLGRVFVADRENGRIQTFDMDGNFQDQIQHPEFGPRLFAIEYCPRHGGLLFAVNGPAFGRPTVQPQGFTLDARTGHMLEQWSIPQGLHNPHDVAVDVAGHSVYVGELNPAAVWKFARPSPTDSVPATPAPAAAQTSTKTPAVATQAADKKNNIPSGDSKDGGSKPEGSSNASTDTSTKDDIAKSLNNELKKEQEEEELSDFTPSIIIGVLLVIPVVLLLVITLVMRVHHKGWTCFSGIRSPKVFNLQSFLGNSHKGFDKLSQDDSDHDNEALSDSDNEEFRQPRKSKA